MAAGTAAVESARLAEDVTLADPEDSVPFVVPSLSWKIPPDTAEDLRRVVLARRDVVGAGVVEALLVVVACSAVVLSVMVDEVVVDEVVLDEEVLDEEVVEL